MIIIFNYNRLFDNAEYRKIALERVSEIAKQCLPEDLYYAKLNSDAVKDYLIKSIQKLNDEELRLYFNDLLLDDESSEYHHHQQLYHQYYNDYYYYHHLKHKLIDRQTKRNNNQYYKQIL